MWLNNENDDLWTSQATEKASASLRSVHRPSPALIYTYIYLVAGGYHPGLVSRFFLLSFLSYIFLICFLILLCLSLPLTFLHLYLIFFLLSFFHCFSLTFLHSFLLHLPSAGASLRSVHRPSPALIYTYIYLVAGGYHPGLVSRFFLLSFLSYIFLTVFSLMLSYFALSLSSSHFLTFISYIFLTVFFFIASLSLSYTHFSYIFLRISSFLACLHLFVPFSFCSVSLLLSVCTPLTSLLYYCACLILLCLSLALTFLYFI